MVIEMAHPGHNVAAGFFYAGKTRGWQMSARQRQETFEHIRNHTEPAVLILGGGINGLGLYRELALQGVDCLLVDKNDFSAGATSKSSRMIHGGLRYLENREFALVKESLFERNRLLTNAAHYVAPLKTCIPLPSIWGGLLRSMLIFFGSKVRPGERGVVAVKFGLWFYDFITRKNRKTPTHYLTSKATSLSQMPGLKTNIIATATYWDAWITQAERLCIELMKDAQAANPNSRALNYVRPKGMENGAVVLEDLVTGQTVAVKPKVVINATGGWVDMTNATLGVTSRFIGGTKGSHLVVDCPKLHKALNGEMVYYQYHDGRVCIVFPFMDKVIMGSTDIRVDDPEKAICDDKEMEYMLTTLRDVFPNLTIRREEIVYVFCGVRPLPAVGLDVLANVSRGHSVQVTAPDAQRPFPLYSLVGGKWTTFRAFAEQIADRLLPELGKKRTCSTDEIPIGGGRYYPQNQQQKQQWIARVAKAAGMAETRVATLMERYGTSAEAYATQADAAAETPLKNLPEYTVGEIRGLSDEYVEHLTDVILRRSVIALLGRATKPALEELAEIVGGVLGWDSQRKAKEVEQALAEVKVPSKE